MHSPSDYMVLDDVHYVTKFPKTFSLNNGTEIDVENDLDIIGLLDFRIEDSVLIFIKRAPENHRKGFWTFLSLPGYQYLGEFLTKGQGPNEFYFPPRVFQTTFFKENEDLNAIIYIVDPPELYQMNITESLKNNRLDMRRLKTSVPWALANFVFIDSTTFFCRSMNDGIQDQWNALLGTHQIRYVFRNGERITPPHFEKLNLARVDPLNFGEVRQAQDLEILSATIKYNSEREIFVEMPIRLNYLNMYSLDGSFGKTICIGKKMDNIKKIQNMEPTDRKRHFIDLQLFPNFWAVAVEKNKHFHEILLFDWKGKPLAELKLNNTITSFGIDLINGYLYTLDNITEAFFKYDIRDILKEIGK